MPPTTSLKWNCSPTKKWCSINFTLKRNENYYSQASFIEKINFKFYTDYQTAFDALNNKNIEGISFLPQSYIGKLQFKNSINIKLLSLSQYTGIFFNQDKNELLKNKYILVVDDNADNRILLSEILFEWEMRPIVCASALEALRMIMSKRYDFALGLIDIHMPGTSGNELAKQIKEENSFFEIVFLDI